MTDDLVSRLLDSEEGKAACRNAGIGSVLTRTFLTSLASTERGRGWLAALAFPGRQIELVDDSVDFPTHGPDQEAVFATLSAAMEVRGE